MKEVKKDIKEEGELIQYNNGKARILLENFYYIVKLYLEINSGKYESFKAYFLDWLSTLVGYDNIEDMGMYIVVDFSEQL